MKKFFTSISKPATIEIKLHPSETAKTKKIIICDPHDQFGAPNKSQTFMIYDKEDPICGDVILKPLKNFDHNGITLELIGQIVLYVDGKQISQFTTLCKDLCPGGTISKEMKIPFQFKNVEKEYESYRGINADLRYFLKVTISRNMFSMVKEQEFWVQCSDKNYKKDVVLANDKPIKLEVGLDQIVLLSIQYYHTFYDLKNAIIEGQLKFYLVNVRIDKAEVSLVKEETAGMGDNLTTDKEVLKKFEVIDGTPAEKEVVPLRLYLSAIEAWKLNVTNEQVNNKFSVKYYIHLALCDAKGRKFYKQREIKLFRSGI